MSEDIQGNVLESIQGNVLERSIVIPIVKLHRGRPRKILTPEEMIEKIKKRNEQMNEMNKARYHRKRVAFLEEIKKREEEERLQIESLPIFVKSFLDTRNKAAKKYYETHKDIIKQKQRERYCRKRAKDTSILPVSLNLPNRSEDTDLDQTTSESIPVSN